MPRILQGDVKHRILEAAEARLWHYGFKKTTIDEIASDAGVGKGTVYLHYESKEDIALAIIAKFKVQSVETIRVMAAEESLDIPAKLAGILKQPILMANRVYSQSEACKEIITSIRPYLMPRLRPYLEDEIGIIAAVLEEGNSMGRFDVPDCLAAAKTLKLMTAGFWPPYPCVSDPADIEREVDSIVELVTRGLARK